MQIQAGQYKGRRVKTVKNAPYRPTTSLVRKSLFDILKDISGKTLLDLFAGSGIVGFEAASRGASLVTFVESSMRVNALLKINGALLLNTEFQYHRRDALKFLENSQSYDIIFADPPYRYHDTNQLVSKALSKLNQDGLLILESSPREFPNSPKRMKEFGDTQLSFWRKEK